jgi:hypothetical protein
VTVVDWKRNPLVTGLTKNDFTITENGKPQRIFSFDTPVAGAETSAGASPTELILRAQERRTHDRP